MSKKNIDKPKVIKSKSLLTFIVGFVCILLGMIIAHCVWYFAVLGLVESDVNAALFRGNNVFGVFEYSERYEDSYLAHISTEEFGEVTIKIPVDTARKLKKGVKVQILNTMCLVEVGETDETDAEV